MVDSRVARRYATALFQAALNADVVRAVESDFALVSSLLEGSEDFRNYLLAPYANREDKLARLDRIFSDRVTGLSMGAIRLLVEKGREDSIGAIHAEFVAQRRAQEGIVYASVISAEALSPEHKEALVAKIQTVIGKRVDASFVVDSTVLGGVKVAYENFVLDGTVQGTLGKLRERLRYELLKQTN
jgi:F-type H+-transporting ATPase subunit delta